jgi:hypothetical protein
VAIFGAVFTAHAVDARSVQSAPERLRQLPGVVAAVADGVHWVYVVAAPIAALGFAITLLLREYPLRGRN